jgi:hypothetical protein
MKQTLHTALLLLLLLVAQAPTLADGKVFARVGPDPTMPDQQALIHFDGRVQTLAIETRFEGEGTDFAWVVPLPSIPEISAATTGLFPTLRAVFAPELADPSEGPLVMAVGLQLCVAVLVLTAAAGGRRGVVIGLAIGLLVVPVLLLPALGKPRGGASTTVAAVTVHERKLVGLYETATISSLSPEALISWIAENGFQMTSNAEPVIAEYVNDGWVFAAIRLSRDAQSGTSTPHPLVFRFPTSRCVYPMRLTGLQDRPLTLDLYVFGTGRAAAPGMRAKRADSVRFGSGKGPGLEVMHDGLSALVPGAIAGTRLTGMLAPAQMRNDVTISFGGMSSYGARIYSYDGAILIAANLGLTVFIVVAIVTAIRLRRRSRDLNASVSWLAGPLLATIAVGALALLWLPKTANIEYGWKPGRLSSVHRDIMFRITTRIADEQERDSGFEPSAEWVRGLLSETGHWESYPPGEGDRVVQFEDSPGNFVVAPRDDNGLDYIWYDLSGRERREWLWSP